MQLVLSKSFCLLVSLLAKHFQSGDTALKIVSVGFPEKDNAHFKDIKEVVQGMSQDAFLSIL